MEKSKISLSRFIIYFIILQPMIFAFGKFSKVALKTAGLEDDIVFLLTQVAVGFLAIVGICLLNMHLRSLNFKKSILFLGFGPINSRQILVGFLSLSPLWLSYALRTWVFHLQIVMTSHWPLHLLGLIVVPGLLEQTLAQGFIYRNLREGRSFFKAATFSAVFWGLSHSYVLLGGYTKEDISFLFQALIGSFLFAYPGAFLFERGNNVIWGFALCHIGIDAPGNVVDFVGESTNSGIWGLSILIGAVGCVGLIFLIGKWLIPEPKKV